MLVSAVIGYAEVMLLLVQEELVGAVTMLLLVKEFMLLLAQVMLWMSAVAVGTGCNLSWKAFLFAGVSVPKGHCLKLSAEKWWCYTDKKRK